MLKIEAVALWSQANFVSYLLTPAFRESQDEQIQLYKLAPY